MAEQPSERNDPAPSKGPVFAVGDKVRVRIGVTDPDSADLPIAGWCGVVIEVDETSDPHGYLVEWDRRTRDHMHPVFIKRCQRDALEVESMWLDETDLEPDDGSMQPIEYPTNIFTRPLRPEDQEDRIRVVFGLTSDDPLPDVSEETLARYHRYLSDNLHFPFDATLMEDTGPNDARLRHLQVTGLRPPEEATFEEGLLCTVKLGDEEVRAGLYDLEIPGDSKAKRLIQDYNYWFSEWYSEPNILPFPTGPELGLDEEPAEQAPPGRTLRLLAQWAALIGLLYGGTVGAIAAVMDYAKEAMMIGSGVMAMLLGLAGRRWGSILASVGRTRRGPVAGMLIGLLGGGVVGVLLGALAVAIVGSMIGSIVGSMAGGYFAPPQSQTIGKFRGGLLGACLGGIILALFHNRDAALYGLGIGALIGALGAVFLLLATLLGLGLLMHWRGWR